MNDQNNPNDPNSPPPASNPSMNWPTTPGGGLSSPQATPLSMDPPPMPVTDPTQNLTPPAPGISPTPAPQSLDLPPTAGFNPPSMPDPAPITLDPTSTQSIDQTLPSSINPINPVSPSSVLPLSESPLPSNQSPLETPQTPTVGSIDGAADLTPPLPEPSQTAPAAPLDATSAWPATPPAPTPPQAPPTDSFLTNPQPSSDGMPPALGHSLGLNEAPPPAPPIDPAADPLAPQSAMPQTQMGTGGGGLPPLEQPPQPSISPPAESAPTDLSHLISENNTGNNNMNHSEVYTPPLAQPENLVMPPTGNAVPETINTPKSNFNLSKLLIIVGVIVVLLVSGLSAYFILGIGKPAPTPASVPAVEDTSTLTNPPKQLETPSPLPASASPSAALDLPPVPTASPKGGSAIDLLKQRQNPSSRSSSLLPTP